MIAQSSIDSWRCETLRALVEHPKVKYQQARILESITSKAKYELSLWLPQRMSSLLESRLEERILRPAMKFHQDKQLSTLQYELERTDTLQLSFTPDLRESWNLKNVQTWTTVKSGEEVECILHCLHPALICLTPDGLVASTLAKPVMVVKLVGTKGSFADEKIRGYVEHYQTIMGQYI